MVTATDLLAAADVEANAQAGSPAALVNATEVTRILLDALGLKAPSRGEGEVERYFASYALVR